MNDILEINFEEKYAIIEIDDTIPLWKVLTRLNDKIESLLDDLKVYEIILVTGKRTLAGGDVYKLYHQLVEKYELSVIRIFSDAPDREDKGNIPVIIESTSRLKNYISNRDEFESASTLFIKKTIRSGQTIDYKGNIVIYGNVNHGSIVRSTGNVSIFGKLYGSVWAGCGGDETCFIVANHFSPTQIRIASFGITGSKIKNLECKNNSVVVINNNDIKIISMEEFIRGH